MLEISTLQEKCMRGALPQQLLDRLSGGGEHFVLDVHMPGIQCFLLPLSLLPIKIVHFAPQALNLRREDKIQRTGMQNG